MRARVGIAVLTGGVLLFCGVAFATRGRPGAIMTAIRRQQGTSFSQARPHGPPPQAFRPAPRRAAPLFRAAPPAQPFRPGRPFKFWLEKTGEGRIGALVKQLQAATP
jgi:hypothetical protein